MLKTKRALLIAGSLIMLCMSAVVGMTYALFTDSESVENHLRAGRLDVALVRTHLSYALLDEDGYLFESSTDEPCDFTNVTEENVFGLTTTDKKIAPGCYFEATLSLQNKGDVAFAYSVGIRMSEENSAFAKQLRLTLMDAEGNILKDGNGNEIPARMLSELSEGLTVTAGEMSADDTEAVFIVRVEFVEQSDYNTPDMTPEEKLCNNDAMGTEAAFDLVVTATQIAG